MTQTPRRIAAIGLTVLLIIGVGYGIFSSARDALGPDDAPAVLPVPPIH